MINAPHTLSTVIVTHNAAIYCISAANHFMVAHQVEKKSHQVEKKSHQALWYFLFIIWKWNWKRRKKYMKMSFKRSVFRHRKPVPELFIAYSYGTSFSRRPRGVQKLNHLSRHWFSFLFFFSLNNEIHQPSSVSTCRGRTTDLRMVKA